MVVRPSRFSFFAEIRGQETLNDKKIKIIQEGSKSSLNPKHNRMKITVLIRLMNFAQRTLSALSRGSVRVFRSLFVHGFLAKITTSVEL